MDVGMFQGERGIPIHVGDYTHSLLPVLIPLHRTPESISATLGRGDSTIDTTQTPHCGCEASSGTPTGVDGVIHHLQSVGVAGDGTHLLVGDNLVGDCSPLARLIAVLHLEAVVDVEEEAG